MLSSPPHGEDCTPFTACVEPAYPVWKDVTEPDADIAGIAIEAQAGMSPLAIPWIGSAKRSNQDNVARMRRSMRAV